MKCTRKQLNLAQIGQQIHAFFCDACLEQLARETGFVQRSSRLTGGIFLQTLVFGFLAQARMPLSQLVSLCAELQVWISPQGLDERIHAGSVAFLQAVFAQALQVFRNHLPLPLLQQFPAVYLLDSSVQALPAALQVDYPGCGGNGPVASLKIQLVFDFLCGQMQQIVLQAGRRADQAYRDYLFLLQPGCLILADLGYVCLGAWQTIQNEAAFFLSRYLYPTALFDGQGQRLEITTLLQQVTTPHLDLVVQLGSRHRLACRLIAIRVSDQVAEERRRKVQAQARRNGKSISQAYLDLQAWSLFVTNVPAERLSWQQVALLYRVRWQIELIFKLWKSYAGWKEIGLWRRERIFTELYAKMIGLVLFDFLLAPLRIPDEGWANREVSPFRAHDLLARFAPRLVCQLTDAASLSCLLEQLLDQWLHFALKQKRVKRPNVCQRLAAPLA